VTDRVLFLVNDLASFKPVQSTWQLARQTAALGMQVGVAGVRDLCVEPSGAVTANAVTMRSSGLGSRMRFGMDGARIWTRLNPGRATAQRDVQVALEALALAEDSSARVLNRPISLWRSGSKLSLMGLPAAARPESFVAVDPVAAQRWARGRDGVVVGKPLLGTQGRGVVCFDPRASMPADLTDATGGVVLQEWIERAHEGDVRVHMVDGHVLEVGGRRAMVRRIPPPGDFRSNVALGGSAVRAEWTAELAHVCDLVGPALRRMGLWHVGLDVVGGRVVEINTFSPGGLTDAGRFEGVDFADSLIRSFLAQTSTA